MKKVSSIIVIAMMLTFVLVFTGNTFAEKSTVSIALESEPSKLNPITFQDFYTKKIFSAICDPLIEIDEKGNYTTEGSVLKNFEVKEDGKIYVFELKEGIEFHNGEKLTAEDVKFTYESLMDKDLASPHRNYYTGIQKLEILDEYKLRVTLEESNAIFLATGRLRDLIVPKDYVEEVGWKGYQNKPIGSGPYKFVEHDQGQKIVLEKNENYWGEKANIDIVEFKFFPEMSSAVMALQTNEIDFLDLPAKDYVSLKNNSQNLKFGKYKEFADARICFNKRPDSIFSNKKLRKAVAYAINREEIIKLSPGNMAVPAVGRIPNFHPAYSSEVNAYEYNPEKAKELLKEAGYPDGFSTELYVPSGKQQRVREVQLIQEHLAKVGIDCKIVTLEWGTYLDVTGEGEAPMFRENWPSISIPSPYTFVAVWDTESSWNSIFGTYSNEKVDQLIDKLHRTPEQSKRWEIYPEIQKIALDDVTSYPLYWPVTGIGYNADLNIPDNLWNVFEKPSFNIDKWSY